MSTSIKATEDAVVNKVNKRYEGLLSLRTKAANGKGAWYWQHLEPILIRNPESNLPKCVKLRCALCSASFSASNPSRTASEHLKRGNCPNSTLILKPNSQLPPLASPSPSHRKRTSGGGSAPKLSGGEEDLKPLALLEDNVKKLKSVKSFPCPSLTKDQIVTAFDLLADWFFESCGAVTLSSLENLKFKAFLNHLGLPEVSKHEFASTRLDSKYEKARMESEARINDAAFFQISSDGWKSKAPANDNGYLVNFTVNLPNGTRVFQRMVNCTSGPLPMQYAEEVLWETVRNACGENPERCVGIVADKCVVKALKNLEAQYHWMVNVPCLLQGFSSLIKDLYRKLPLFATVAEKCPKVADLINSQPQVRHCLRKVLDHRFIRVPSPKCEVSKNLGCFVGMLEDILSCSQTLHLTILDDSFKFISLDDCSVGEVAEIIRDVRFWNDVEAAHSLVKLITMMGDEVEAERPLIGQCLPLWKELKDKVREWRTKHGIHEGLIEEIVQKRFVKSYHPAWSVAFVLDPLYLVRDVSSGKYLPPFKFLTGEQEKDVEHLVTRMVSGEEACTTLMELVKWRSEGLDPLYAQAVQVKQRDPVTGKMKVANPQSSRLVWETCLKGFESLGKVAARVLFLQATSSCGIKCDQSVLRWFYGQGSSTAGKMVFIAAQAKLGRRESYSSEEKDAED